MAQPHPLRVARVVIRFVHDLLGDSAYGRYVARHRIEHPDHPPMTAREFWRQRSHDDAPPRCC